MGRQWCGMIGNNSACKLNPLQKPHLKVLDSSQGKYDSMIVIFLLTLCLENCVSNVVESS